MSLLAVAARLQKTAVSLRETERLLEQSGGMIAKEIRTNIEMGRVAGELRPDMDSSGAAPGGKMTPLSKYTIRKRGARGNPDSRPLDDTGRLYREIGTRGASAVRVIVGGTTNRARMLLRKHMGTAASAITSTDLDRPVPHRSPVGYSRKLLSTLLSLVYDKLGAGDNTSGSANYEIRL